MIFHRLGLINKDQKGFTLIEVLVTLAITGLIAVGATTAIFQVFGHNTRNTAHMTAVCQVENAVRWINNDAQMAQTVEPSGDSGFPLNLTWIEWNNTSHQVTYTLEDGKLKRSHSVDGGEPSESVAARYIDPDSAKTNCGLTTSGTFSLYDITDAFTITGGAAVDSGTITVTAGSISVATTGTATYDSGDWTTPAAGDTVVVSASSADTLGVWTSTVGSAVVTLTEDADGDANINGKVLKFKVTATVGDGSYSSSETGVREVAPRPGL